jgi:hypothetical protein
VPGVPDSLEFVYLPVFERAIKGVLDDEACRALEQQLIDDPESGDQMAGTGGVRKLRLAIGGRGKSAGLRVVYYYRANASRVYLITAFAKKHQANLTNAQKNAMKQLTAILSAET